MNPGSGFAVLPAHVSLSPAPMRLAVIGAGAAGLAAAYGLRNSTLDVTVFEKSRGVSGRAATRRRTTAHGPWRYDHGANYVKTPEESPAGALLHEELATEGLVDIARDVWTFDAEGSLRAGDPAHDREGKWTYTEGISQLGKRLAAAARAPVHTETRITHLTRSARGWTLHADGSDTLGPFDAVLITPPAPQGADLLAASSFDADRRAVLVDALRAATYRKQFTLALAFDRAIERPDDRLYALLNADGAHPVAWLAFEEDKPGHVPEGCSLLVAQMASGWTRDHYAEDLDALVTAARPLLAELLGVALPDPLWADRQRWRYALPDRPADTEALATGDSVGLFFAGDYEQGAGRVHRALESGLGAASRIRAWCGA